MLTAAQGAYWHTDFGQAQTKAYGENRLLFVLFTGSDWCTACARLQQEVLSTFEFQTFADRHLVLVEVDFPRWKQLSGAQRQANRALATKYMASGYPRIVLANSQGEKIGMMSYMAGGPEAYIKAIEQQAGLTRKPAGPSEPPLMFSGAPTGKGPKYTDLSLKSISGSGTKRLALINNQTLAAGESGKVRLGAGEVKVRCEEIREKSVIVTVDGKKERRELRLAEVKKAAAEQARVR
jgi:hypothetical protein